MSTTTHSPQPPAPQDVAQLRYYRSAASGRGRICGVSARLLKAGCLKRINTGVYTWALLITPRGAELEARAALKLAQG